MINYLKPYTYTDTFGSVVVLYIVRMVGEYGKGLETEIRLWTSFTIRLKSWYLIKKDKIIKYLYFIILYLKTYSIESDLYYENFKKVDEDT